MNLLGLSGGQLALLLGTAVGLVTLLHFLRVRPIEHEVPTLIFWRHAVEETRARSLFGRFRHPGTWAFLAGILALLALAVADPTTERGEAERRHLIFVLDGGVTMSAPSEDADLSRLQQGKAILRAAVSKAALYHRTALLLAKESSRLTAGFDAPRSALLDALDRATSGEYPGDLISGVQLATSLGNGRPQAEIHVITDQPRPASGIPDKVIWHGIGGSSRDQAISASEFTDRLNTRILGKAVGARRLVVRDGTESLAEVEVSASSEAERWITIDGLPRDGRTVTLELVPPDDVSGNDRARFTLPNQPSPRVWISGSGLDELRTLLGASPLLRLATSRDACDLVVSLEEATVRSSTQGPLRLGSKGFMPALSYERLPKLAAETLALAVSAGVEPLVTQGEAVLVTTRNVSPKELQLAPVIVRGPKSWLHQATGASLLLSVIARAGGEAPASSSIPAEGFSEVNAGLGDPSSRRAHPALDNSSTEVVVAHAGPVPLGTKVQAELTPPPKRWALWEFLALCGLGLLLLDARLWTKGRIP